MKGIDAEAHRRNLNYTPEIKRKRVLWGMMKVMFHCSPRPFYRWRNALLRRFGAKVDRTVRLYPSVEVFYPWNVQFDAWVTLAWNVKIYSLGKIHLAERVMISQGAHLCAGTHDFRKPNYPLLTPPISIGAGTWICAEAFIGPGVTVGEGAIIASRAVVVKDVPASSIAGGNPARVIKEL